VTKRLDLFAHKFKSESGLHLRISAGMFLFILFFQPFPLTGFSFNNYILIIAGLGAIIFFAFATARILLPLIIGKDEDVETQIFPPYLKGLLIFLISATAFVFYLMYVGSVRINFYIVFKIALICIAPPVILDIYDTVYELKKQINSLVSERKAVQRQVEKFEEDYLNKSVEFISENDNENFILHIAEVALIRSADNYVEIVYKEGVTFKKKLIRNTMKNIEQQIRDYSNFLRCHRVCIVNVHFVDSLRLISNNYTLIIKGFDEKIPVSRQYLLKLREAL